MSEQFQNTTMSEQIQNPIQQLYKEECFLMEVLTHDFKPAVRLGCIDNLVRCKYLTLSKEY